MQGSEGARGALCKGVYAVDWGYGAGDPVTPGMVWRWHGQALRLDGGAPALWLARPLARTDIRPRARTRLRRLSAAARARPDPDLASVPDAPPGGLILTDGRQTFAARLILCAGRVAVVFDPWLPPPDTDLWVQSVAPGAAPLPRPAPGGLTQGTRVDTPQGPRAVETLEPGDLILTRDRGAQPLVWRGETRLSGAELILHPHLRPLRLAPGALGMGRPTGPLRLAPGHRLMVRTLPGLATGLGLGTGAEALATAADLEDGRGIRRDFACASVTYHHLMLTRHEVIRAEGVDCETFHPGLTDPIALRWHARGLERASPGVTRAPERFGDPARRCLGAGEAALLRRA